MSQVVIRTDNAEVIVPLRVSTGNYDGIGFDEEGKLDAELRPVVKLFGFQSVRHFEIACKRALMEHAEPLLQKQSEMRETAQGLVIVEG